LRAACLPDGLATAHFRWQPEAVRSLLRQIKILLVTFVLPTYALILLAERSGRVGGGELLRVLLLVLLAGLSVFLYRFFAPRHGIAVALDARGFSAAVARHGWLWPGVALAIPAFLAVQTLAGYVYSAGTLLSGVIFTLWLLTGALLVHEVVYRWLLVARRRLRLQQMLARREAQRATKEDETIDELGIKRTDLDTAIDIKALDADTRKLIRVAVLLGTIGGVYWIWSDLLPKLTVLDSIGLWKTDAGAGPDQPLRTVTLGDLFLGLAVIALTYIAATTLPSVIEIILRQRARLGHGSRIAFATLTRYSIVVVGAFVAFSLFGASWSKLQWLVAALGVGIGFGLQEIVANFISGLIILIERPVRVGDVVTVGDVEGVVSRIQIRATTVTNWKHQEHLVPNKEFITGRVMNWSLSDEVTRLEVPVGVAYGSDVELALDILAEIAAEHPKVLEEPAPLVGFFSFGDNALGLELRCFVPGIGDLSSTRTDLHLAINRRFEAAGIEIAFPQRDVHLDVARPLEINFRRQKDDRQPPVDADAPRSAGVPGRSS
jgi:potassium efflux system protein